MNSVRGEHAIASLFLSRFKRVSCVRSTQSIWASAMGAGASSGKGKGKSAGASAQLKKAQASEEEAKALFAKLDANSDGKLSAAEIKES